jgi:phosphoglycerate dehydrogenase-like enzyme
VVIGRSKRSVASIDVLLQNRHAFYFVACLDAEQHGTMFDLRLGAVEPLPVGHVLTTLPNVTLSAHSAFRTPEASDNLIGAALDHCRHIVTTVR